MSASALKPDHSPTSDEIPKDLNLERYLKYPDAEVYYDPRPRIRNIVKELQDEHGWSWPPEPPKDWDKIRDSKAKKWSIFYTQFGLDFCSIVSLIVGLLELVVAFSFLLTSKTFTPAIRESAIYCILFECLFLLQGLSHVHAAVVGFGLRSLRPWRIGFIHVSYNYAMIHSLLGAFVSAIGVYCTQDWRIRQEMIHKMKEYNEHRLSQDAWDSYQTKYRCCGITNRNDWSEIGPVLESEDGAIISFPASCCPSEFPQCHLQKNLVNQNFYKSGCLPSTLLWNQIIFGVAAFSMVVGFFLSVIGFWSRAKAEDSSGDPIHSSIFDTPPAPCSIPSMQKRKEELLYLLNYYCLQLGLELGLNDEVEAAMKEEGISAEDWPSNNPKPDPPSPPPSAGNVNKAETDESSALSQSSALPRALKLDHSMPEETPNPEGLNYENETVLNSKNEMPSDTAPSVEFPAVRNLGVIEEMVVVSD